MLVNVALSAAGWRRRHTTHETSEAEIMGPDWLRTFEGVEPMGRGRAKAKQVKVARQLKYSGGGMDLDQLRAEFGVGTDEQDADEHAAYADLADRYSVDDEDDDPDDEDELDDEDIGDRADGSPRAGGSAGSRMSRASGT